MSSSSTATLNTHLKPLCSRDNNVMKYEAHRSRLNAGDEASFHCGFGGCSVRYNTNSGYFMLISMPEHANPVAEPGVNTLQCPKHHLWLYRRYIDAEAGVLWGCGVEGCDYGYNAATKGDRVCFPSVLLSCHQ
jgi:hypothetical protein